jgi:hypothetical protein
MTRGVTQGKCLSVNVTWAVATVSAPAYAWHALARIPACVSGLHAPEIVVNVEPGLASPWTGPEGVAITHGLMSSGNWAEQVPCGGLEGSTFVQTIPPEEVVTTPVPVPANVTVSVHVPVAIDDAEASADAPSITSTQTARNTRETVIFGSLPF